MHHLIIHVHIAGCAIVNIDVSFFLFVLRTCQLFFFCFMKASEVVSVAHVHKHAYTHAQSRAKPKMSDRQEKGTVKEKPCRITSILPHLNSCTCVPQTNSFQIELLKSSGCNFCIFLNITIYIAKPKNVAMSVFPNIVQPSRSRFNLSIHTRTCGAREVCRYSSSPRLSDDHLADFF